MTVDREQLSKLLPGYDIGDELGRGGSGTVVSGWHRQLRRGVAIKQLAPALTSDPEVRTRFVSEARVLAALDHPHIVPVYDFVEADGFCVLVMEQLSGGTVWTRFADQGLSMERACAVVVAVCSGLEAAHRLGVLHRDMKPDNVLFSSGGVAKITDFGIARIVGGGDTLATRAGQILGTPAYMAPEQATCGAVGPFTDVYAVATMLYELLSGRLPFSDEDEGDAFSVMYRHVHEEPVPLGEVAPSVPRSVAEVVMHGLAARPEDRLPSAEALGAALGAAAAEAWGEAWLEQQTDVGGGEAIRIGVPVVSNRAPVAGASGEPDHQNARLEPLHRLVARPVRSGLQMAVALCLLVAGIGVALRYSSVTGASGSIPAGAATIAGMHPGGGSVPLDLASPIAFRATLPGSMRADTAALSFSVAGVPLGAVTSPLAVGAGGESSASLEANDERFVVPSGATATISLRRNAATVGDVSFPVTSSQSPWLTAPCFVAILLLLVSSAYIESLLRSLRRRRRGLSAVPGLLVMGATLGLSVSLLAWLATGRPPTPGSLVACAALAAAAASVAGIATLNLGLHGERPRQGPTHSDAGARRAAA